jgi:hypothetical protein
MRAREISKFADVDIPARVHHRNSSMESGSEGSPAMYINAPTFEVYRCAEQRRRDDLLSAAYRRGRLPKHPATR